MEVNIIKIGNSKGLIIPSKLLKLVRVKKKVSLEVEDDKIIIKPASPDPREGWGEMIKEALDKEGQPERLMPDFFEEEDNSDWEW